MFEHDNRIYYERRAAQATELGDRATNPTVVALHYELALHYRISIQVSQAKAEIVALRKDRKSAAPEHVRAVGGVSLEPELEAELALPLKHG